VVDEFRQAAARQPYRRSAEGECLDYRRSSWLFPQGGAAELRPGAEFRPGLRPLV